MKITEREQGTVILALCTFFGFVYPMSARWILLVLCLSAIWNWWKEK